jgi:hypothetical protein
MLLVVDRGLRPVLVGVGMYRGGRAEKLSEDVDFDEVIAVDPGEVLSILGWRELPLLTTPRGGRNKNQRF